MVATPYFRAFRADNYSMYLILRFIIIEEILFGENLIMTDAIREKCDLLLRAWFLPLCPTRNPMTRAKRINSFGLIIRS